MYCPNCGTKNSDDALFCEECGTSLKEYREDQSVNAKTDHTNEHYDSEQSKIVSSQASELGNNSNTIQANPRLNNGVSSNDMHDNGISGNAIPNNRINNNTSNNGIPNNTMPNNGMYNNAAPNNRAPKNGIPKAVVPFVIIGAAVAVILVAAGLLLATDNPVKKFIKGSDKTVESSYEDDDDDDDYYAIEETEETEEDEGILSEIKDKFQSDEPSIKYTGSWGGVEIASLDGETYYVNYGYWNEDNMNDVYDYYLRGYYDESRDAIICHGFCNHVTANFTPDPYYVSDGEIYVYFNDEGYPIVHNGIYGVEDDTNVDWPRQEADLNDFYISIDDYDPSATELGNDIVFTKAENLANLGLSSLNRNELRDIAESSYIVQEGDFNNAGISAFDGDSVTSWQVDVDNGIRSYVYGYLQDETDPKLVTFNLGNWRTPELYAENDRPKTVEFLFNYQDDEDDKPTRRVYVTFPDEMEEYAIVFPDDFYDDVDYFEFNILDYYPGTKYTDNCVSEISIYSE